MDGVLIVAILVFASIAQATWVATAPTHKELSFAAQRLASFAIRPAAMELEQGVDVTRKRRQGRFPFLERLLERLNVADRLGNQLLHSGIPLRAGEFFFIMIVCATIAAFVGLLLGSRLVGGFLASGMGAIVGFLAPLMWLKMKEAQRIDQFESALPDVLDLIAGSLRAGYGIAHGLDTVARDGSGPTAEEFGQVLMELNLGRDLDVALVALSQRINSEDARLLATAIGVQRRSGGNLIEVFSQMSGVMRERLRLRRDVRVITTAPRVSGYVVALLPVATVAFMFLTTRYYADTLLNEPMGRVAMAVGGVLVLIGLYLNHRIAKVDM